ncbi:hypothetical protein A3Q56_04670 [Intoshia linei]|uniref:SWIM-type domain-containing protein n=1 Tax=Intoshia linei TaxID=1819745 RepID=A0A177B059_9BILA|nr:hypothetical protein A3Q56_04670 [Intoshia linei]
MRAESVNANNEIHIGNPIKLAMKAFSAIEQFGDLCDWSEYQKSKSLWYVLKRKALEKIKAVMGVPKHDEKSYLAMKLIAMGESQPGDREKQNFVLVNRCESEMMFSTMKDYVSSKSENNINDDRQIRERARIYSMNTVFNSAVMQKYGPCSISIGDLYYFCLNNSSIPTITDNAYVVKHSISDNSAAITSGFSNVFNMKKRINCWFHIIKSVEKHVSFLSLNSRTKNEIKSDICHIPLQFFTSIHEFLFKMTDAYQWIQKRKTIIMSHDQYYVPTGNDVDLTEDQKVSLNRNNWKFLKCTCPFWSKPYMCKHSIGIAIRLKIDGCIVPREAKALSLNIKKKRGRPAQTNQALMRQ